MLRTFGTFLKIRKKSHVHLSLDTGLHESIRMMPISIIAVKPPKNMAYNNFPSCSVGQLGNSPSGLPGLLPLGNALPGRSAGVEDPRGSLSFVC